MREPRPGLPWSLGRVRTRAAYREYMDSTEWWARRRAWHAEWVDRHGIDPTCRACDAPWTRLHGDLHHASYTRLGDERFTDLMPLCRTDHAALHDILDTTVGWRHLGRPTATAGIITILRRLHHLADVAELW